MSLEICKICKNHSTPWFYFNELRGHICEDCFHNRMIEYYKNLLDKAIEHIEKTGYCIDSRIIEQITSKDLQEYCDSNKRSHKHYLNRINGNIK